jgi:hypothetical protein
VGFTSLVHIYPFEKLTMSSIDNEKVERIEVAGHPPMNADEALLHKLGYKQVYFTTWIMPHDLVFLI